MGKIPYAKEQEFEISDFFYLPNVKHFEGISPTTLHRFLFGEKMETKMDKTHVLIEYALTKSFVVFDEFFRDMPAADVLEFLRRLDESEIYYLVISSDYFFAIDSADRYPRIGLFENDPTSACIKNDQEKENNKAT